VTFPRPRSLSGLILVGLLLVSLPLLAGVVSAVLEMTRLSESSERLVIHGVQATRYSQALVRQVAAMERTARLYQLLGRSELKAVFDENHRRMTTVLEGVTALPGDEARNEVVAEIRRRADLVADALNSTETAVRAEALGEFGPLARDTGRLSLLASQQIDRELIGMQQQTERVRRRLLWQSAALAPITLGFALVFALFVGRPIRDIDRAIGNLGHGRLLEPVHVRGPPTDLEALGRQIEWLRQRLLEVSEERERFLRHVSHELKTPLANIREGSELLLEGTVGRLQGEQREIAGIMRENSLRLQQLIENLLSYSEWQARRGELDIGEFRLAPLVHAVTESYQLPLTTHRLRLETSIEDITLRADRTRLRLVIDNLVSNAIKFSPEGGTIHVRAGVEGTEAVIDVADAGPGIASEERVRIFEPFFQGATPQGGLVRGTGIGLSVVQEFVHAHGGRVELVDGDLPGAHFRVHLPLDTVARSASA
jgi:two-component system sensor histidine kinase GlrK